MFCQRRTVRVEVMSVLTSTMDILNRQGLIRFAPGTLLKQIGLGQRHQRLDLADSLPQLSQFDPCLSSDHRDFPLP